MLKKTLSTTIIILCLTSTVTVASTPRISLIPRTFSIIGGVRTVFGDDRNFALGIAGEAGGEWQRYELIPVRGAIGSAIAFALDGSLDSPLSYGFDFDLGFGEMTIIGVGFGIGYNIPLALDDAMSYVQLKLNTSFMMTFTDFGELPIENISNGSKIVNNPHLDLASEYIVLRPEVNYFRYLSSARSLSFVDGLFLRASFGFNIPISEMREPRLRFSSVDGGGSPPDVREFSVPISDENFALFAADSEGGDWHRVEKTDISPLGIVATLGFTFEF